MSGEPQQLLVRQRAPQEEGKLRGQLSLRHRKYVAGTCIGRRLDDKEQELGSGENALDGEADTGFETASCALPIESQQFSELEFGRFTAVCLLCQ